VDCEVTEAERTAAAIVYRAVIRTGFSPDILTVRPVSGWVRWDPESSVGSPEGRRIEGRITVGLPGGAGPQAVELRINGRPFRRVELP